MMRVVTAAVLLCWLSFAHPADISVNVKGAPGSGTLVFQVYNSPSAFGDFRDPIKEMRADVGQNKAYLIENVPAGEVAVLVYVDENDNGIIDKNFIGIPREALGISNSYRPKGPPTFERASFNLAENKTKAIDIEIYKVLGERGRIGVGIGVIGRSSPYIGSDSTVLNPIPAITYNGKRLQWLGPNVQYGIVGTGRWRLAASASFRIGVYEEDDSIALAGMGDRDSTLMAGLGFRYELPGGVNLAMSYEHDVLNKIGGGNATARLSRSFQAGWLRLVPQLQVNWLSEELANYDFGVAARQATLNRPVYNTDSAISYEAGIGSFIELTEAWRIVFNVSAEFLPDRITDSPIVDDDHVIKGFAAVTYVF